jgi:hypothetical protein
MILFAPAVTASAERALFIGAKKRPPVGVGSVSFDR